jgi:hypothetical protein
VPCSSLYCMNSSVFCVYTFSFSFLEFVEPVCATYA